MEIPAESYDDEFRPQCGIDDMPDIGEPEIEHVNSGDVADKTDKSVVKQEPDKKKRGRPSKNLFKCVRDVWPETLTVFRSQFTDSESLSQSDVINLTAYFMCTDTALREQMILHMTKKQLLALSKFIGRNEAERVYKELERISLKVDTNIKATRDTRNLVYDNLCLSSYDLMDRKGWNTREEVESQSMFAPVSGVSGEGDPDVVVDVCALAQRSRSHFCSRLNEPEGREIGKAVGNKTIHK